jgi:hypothetical protein
MMIRRLFFVSSREFLGASRGCSKWAAFGLVALPMLFSSAEFGRSSFKVESEVRVIILQATTPSVLRSRELVRKGEVKDSQGRFDLHGPPEVKLLITMNWVGIKKN